MSIFTKDAEQIRKAKYRVKNAQGQYEVVYLETSADQVEQTADRVFVTPAEKSQITTNKEAIAAEKSAREAADQALANRLNVIEGEGEGSVKKALQDAKSYSDAELAKKVAELQNADAALSTRVQANETALGKVAGQISTAKQEAIDAAEAHTNSAITSLKGEMNTADAAIKGRLDSLETNTADLATIRTNIAANTSAISKEVTDRTNAVKSVDDKLTAEVERATQAETTLTGKISNVEAEVGRVETSLTGKVDEAIQSAKDYADSKIEEVNSVNDGLSERVGLVEADLKTVDTRISTAKGQAETAAKSYTDGQVSTLKTTLEAADAKVLADAKADTQSKVQELNTNLTNSINAVDTKVDGIGGRVTTLEGKVSKNESDIANLKDAVANKNNNTIVVNTEDEIASENTNPKVGDIAFVVSSKRAYIYKGVAALAVDNAPAGWVVFDEITSELDLVDYMKTADANATFRKLSEKIAEADLATELATKINSKLDAGQVDSKISAAVNPVNEKAVANTAAITKEVSDRKSEITRVEGVLNTAKTELNSSISSVNSKVDTVKSDLTSSLNTKEAALKAEDTKLNNRINKFAPVISGTEPQGTETGHVWLELV
jgi:chromosome segregation ATPase